MLASVVVGPRYTPLNGARVGSGIAATGVSSWFCKKTAGVKNAVTVDGVGRSSNSESFASKSSCTTRRLSRSVVAGSCTGVGAAKLAGEKATKVNRRTETDFILLLAGVVDIIVIGEARKDRECRVGVENSVC